MIKKYLLPRQGSNLEPSEPKSDVLPIPPQGNIEVPTGFEPV